MNQLLPPHRGGYGHAPPRKDVEALVDKDERAPNHWYWNGDVWEDLLDRIPVFKWRAPGTRMPARYVVARLLWAWEFGHVDHKYVHLSITCGLGTCVNPGHVRWCDEPEKSMTLPEWVNAQLVHRAQPVHSHLALFHKIHIQNEGASTTMCGVKLDCVVLPFGKPITCMPCLKAWKALGRPLIVATLL